MCELLLCSKIYLKELEEEFEDQIVSAFFKNSFYLYLLKALDSEDKTENEWKAFSFQRVRKINIKLLLVCC